MSATRTDEVAESRPSRAASAIGYRPGLDGVRALSVLAVILYHDNVSWARGGFLGVDMFFVLSGYLITSLLLVEMNGHGRIDLISFWTRRARRLLPGLYLMLIGVVIYSRIWAKPDEMPALRSEVVATLLYVSNWKFIVAGTSYFQAFQTPSLLQHTWSLAIEEQWYLVWPPVLILLIRWTKGRTISLAAVTTLMALGSAALMAAMFHPGTDPSRLYYGTDTRAQTLLVGAVFAVLSVGASSGGTRIRDPIRRPWITQLIGVLCLVLLAVAVAHTGAASAWLYRGGFLLVALAAMGVIAAAAGSGFLASALSVAPLRAIGKISYGLYLWHWPVTVVMTGQRTGLHDLPLNLARFLVTLGFATASYFAVERPIRRMGTSEIKARARVARRVVMPGMVALLVVAIITVARSGQPSALAIAVKSGSANQPHPKARGADNRLLMLGDSQMFTMMFFDGAQFAQPGTQVDSEAVIGCGVFTAAVHIGSNCDVRARVWKDRIRTYDPDLSVLLVGAWEALDFTFKGHHYVHGTPEHEHELEHLIETSIRPLTARGGRVALLETPCFGPSPNNDPTSPERAESTSVANVNQALRAVAARNAREITFVPWAKLICPDGRFVSKIDGLEVRPDGVHFGSTRATKIAVDYLEPIIQRLTLAAHDERRS